MQFGGDKDDFVGNDADGSGSGGEILVELTITIFVTNIPTNTMLSTTQRLHICILKMKIDINEKDEQCCVR